MTTTFKLTLRDIALSKESLDRVMETKLPVTVAWKLARAGRVIEGEFESYEKVRMELVKKYGKEVEVGTGQFQIIGTSMEPFQNEMDELFKQEVEVTVPLIALNDLDGQEFQPRDLAFIWFLFEEEHDESS